MDKASDEKGQIPDFINPKDLQVLAGEPASKSKEETPQVDNEIEDDILDDEYLSGFEDGLDTADNDLESFNVDAVLQKREDTRSRLALIFTMLTFLIFLIGMFIAVLDGILRDVSIIDNLKEIIPLISGVFLGSLGFVLGYYFRKGDEE